MAHAKAREAPRPLHHGAAILARTWQALPLLALSLLLPRAATAQSLDLEGLAPGLGSDSDGAGALAASLVECPASLDVARAGRTVAQTLGGTVFRWREFDLEGGTCVVLLDPEIRPLAPKSAGLLLTASRAAEERAASAPGPGGLETRSAAPTGQRSLLAVPHTGDRTLAALAATALRSDRRSRARSLPRGRAEALAPKAQVSSPSSSISSPSSSVASKLVFGGDDRIRVLDTTQFPWRTVCYVESVFPDGSVFGLSGVLAGPYTVLTSALALYQPDHGGWVESVEVVPGQTQELEGGDIYAPWGSQFGVLVEVPLAWVEEADPASLYGAIFLEQPFAGLADTMPLVFDDQPAGQVNMAGYDQTAHGEGDSYAQWTRTGSLRALDAVYFDHRMDDDAGAIGAPVWEFFQATASRRIFGVNCCILTDQSANSGIRFTSANEELITEWLLYEPDGGGGGGGDGVEPVPLFIGGGGNRFRVEALWRDHQGNRGSGQPIVLTEDTGYFWFFGPDNVEVVVKVLDACTLNDHFWVFAAGLTDVEVSLQIEDTVTGTRWSAFNPRGQAFRPIQDTEALAVCP